VRKRHLDFLAIAARLRERRRFGKGSGDIACGLNFRDGTLLPCLLFLGGRIPTARRMSNKARKLSRHAFWRSASWRRTVGIGQRAFNYTAGPRNYSYGGVSRRSSKVDALSTFRARFGDEFNGTMPYVTAGLAVGMPPARARICGEQPIGRTPVRSTAAEPPRDFDADGGASRLGRAADPQ
jgi:hypothetical protein